MEASLGRGLVLGMEGLLMLLGVVLEPMKGGG